MPSRMATELKVWPKANGGGIRLLIHKIKTISGGLSTAFFIGPLIFAEFSI